MFVITDVVFMIYVIHYIQYLLYLFRLSFRHHFHLINCRVIHFCVQHIHTYILYVYIANVSLMFLTKYFVYYTYIYYIINSQISIIISKNIISNRILINIWLPVYITSSTFFLSFIDLHKLSLSHWSELEHKKNYPNPIKNTKNQTKLKTIPCWEWEW